MLDVEDDIATLTINKPQKLNALDSKLLDELDEALEEIFKREDVKGIIITGAGEKAFVAGADIQELQNLNVKSGSALSRKGHRIFEKIENAGKPFIALVNGFALGGGCELAMACHLRVATPKAKFGLPEVGLGLIPGYGGTQRLTRLIGKGRAMEMILTGKHINADKAFEVGLVNKLVEDTEAMKETRFLMSKILSNSPIAIKQAIVAINSAEGDTETGFSKETVLFGELFETHDFKEGVSAFLNKRSPKFTGN